MADTEAFENDAKSSIQSYLDAKDDPEREEVLIGIVENDLCIVENLVKWAASHLEMKPAS